ncbi:MAG: hypothetical protein JWP30_769 [Homoserinimonas sp.]|jgi:hypothetical protein|nr:hypothetical protein [Homoserinimonas sp.]
MRRVERARDRGLGRRSLDAFECLPCSARFIGRGANETLFWSPLQCRSEQLTLRVTDRFGGKKVACPDAVVRAGHFRLFPLDLEALPWSFRRSSSPKQRRSWARCSHSQPSALASWHAARRRHLRSLRRPRRAQTDAHDLPHRDGPRDARDGAVARLCANRHLGSHPAHCAAPVPGHHGRRRMGRRDADGSRARATR